MYDAFPEADGMWLEIGDEGDYACHDPECRRPLDDFGSKASGQASTSFLREFSGELWAKHPKAKLAWGIGYPEAYRWDVKYYESLRKDFEDPRYSFLEVRQNWMLQDSEGVLRPIRRISPNPNNQTAPLVRHHLRSQYTMTTGWLTPLVCHRHLHRLRRHVADAFGGEYGNRAYRWLK